MGVVLALVVIAVGAALVWFVPINIPLVSGPVAGFILIGVGIVMIGWAVVKHAERVRVRRRSGDSSVDPPPGV